MRDDFEGLLILLTVYCLENPKLRLEPFWRNNYKEKMAIMSFHLFRDTSTTIILTNLII